MKKKPNGRTVTATLNAKEISDVLTRYALQKQGIIGDWWNTEMRTTATPEAVFIELKIEELEPPESKK